MRRIQKTLVRETFTDDGSISIADLLDFLIVFGSFCDE